MNMTFETLLAIGQIIGSVLYAVAWAFIGLLAKRSPRPGVIPRPPTMPRIISFYGIVIQSGIAIFLSFVVTLHCWDIAILSQKLDVPFMDIIFNGKAAGSLYIQVVALMASIVGAALCIEEVSKNPRNVSLPRLRRGIRPPVATNATTPVGV